MELAGASGLRDEVDAGVATIQALSSSPISIGPDMAIEVAVTRLVAQVGEDDLLEVGSLFSLREGVVSG